MSDADAGETDGTTDEQQASNTSAAKSKAASLSKDGSLS